MDLSSIPGRNSSVIDNRSQGILPALLSPSLWQIPRYHPLLQISTYVVHPWCTTAYASLQSLKRVTCAHGWTYFVILLKQLITFFNTPAPAVFPWLSLSKQRSQSVTLYSCRCLIIRVSFIAFLIFWFINMEQIAFQFASRSNLRRQCPFRALHFTTHHALHPAYDIYFLSHFGQKCKNYFQNFHFLFLRSHLHLLFMGNNDYCLSWTSALASTIICFWTPCQTSDM